MTAFKSPNPHIWCLAKTKKKFTSYKFHQFGFFFYLISLSPHLNRNAMLSFFLLFHVQQCYSLLTTRKKVEKTLTKTAEWYWDLSLCSLGVKAKTRFFNNQKKGNASHISCSHIFCSPLLLLYRSPLLIPLHFLFILSTSPLHPRHRSHPPHGSIPKKSKS